MSTAKHAPKKDADPKVETIKDRNKESTARNTPGENRRRRQPPSGGSPGHEHQGLHCNSSFSRKGTRHCSGNTYSDFSKIMLDFYFFLYKNGSGQRSALTLVTDGMEKNLFEKKNKSSFEAHICRKEKILNLSGPPPGISCTMSARAKS